MDMIFETTDGQEAGRATFTKHPFLRPPQIMFKGIWHYQNRLDGETWVYRAVNGIAGIGITDPALKDIT